jgi:hypothetical protein
MLEYLWGYRNGSVQEEEEFLYLTAGHIQIFQTSRNHLKILGARWETWSKFHTEDPQMLYTSLQNLVAQITLHPGFVHPYREHF